MLHNYVSLYKYKSPNMLTDFLQVFYSPHWKHRCVWSHWDS